MASQYPPKRSDWTERKAPGLDAFEAIATEALASLPADFLALCGNLQISVSDLPTDDMLRALEIDDPYELLGLFEGNGLAEGGGEAFTGQMPNRIWLFRRPILDYWACYDETLGDVVAHVLIHEIGHHFGLSDADMEAVEAAADA
ncbi:Zn-dependent protease [Roseibium aquae]|uniref:Zn-dependent protease n=1 Tax=Roseibium aquae TaxID=1323746 RepID=A0A916WWK2_9HYPH|nr:metallopeptidase family protein [Roseibium aquae]GGB38205.1 Zn-dependent protease [Roseibium aquae]